MAKLRFRISISLDGYCAGPNQSVREPLGAGGERLHEWTIVLKSWRESHGMTGGETNANDAVSREAFENVGASLMGRNMFGGHPGPWSASDPWKGWWGKEPPFHHPVFVLTHHPREPLTLGETTFHFVTDGIGSALEQAKRAAGSKDVLLGGGASAARQYLAAGLVDRMDLALIPILLGSGERVFDGLGTDLHGLAVTRTIAGPGVTHLRFERG